MSFRRNFIAAALMLSACQDLGPIKKELESLRAVLELQNKSISTLDQEMQDGFRLALCRPEIRQLLEDVRTECKAIVDPQAPKPVGKKDDPAVCETKKIHPAVMSADPEHKGRFLKFMSLLRHEVFYMRKGAKEIVRSRRERLEKLAAQPVLKNTVFLVVAHPVPGDPEGNVGALRRAELIASKLKVLNPSITDERVTIWVYEFPVGKGEIDNQIDLPITGEPGDLNLSIWVFRADC